ncbi:MAG: serine/threonine protein kinase [Polyangiaceae bacterium]|nr:serine/threonine protein kinase [Polyangiaceae bacterium]
MPSNQDPALPLSACVGGFQVADLLVSGTRAVWLRARKDGKLYVLKVPTHGYARDDTWRRRMAREADLLQLLAGGPFPTLIAAGVYDTTDAADIPYVVTDLPDGLPLPDVRARQASPDVALAVRVLSGLLEALSFAHARGVVHRNLKPDKITLLRAGTLRIEDLQLGLGAATPALTRQGSFVGSLDYSAPEQLSDAHSVDGRADLYAAGLIAYELMTHTHPYAGASNERDAMFRRKLDHPESASRRNPAVGEPLASVVSKLVAHDRDARPATADAALAALRFAAG